MKYILIGAILLASCQKVENPHVKFSEKSFKKNDNPKFEPNTLLVKLKDTTKVSQFRVTKSAKALMTKKIFNAGMARMKSKGFFKLNVLDPIESLRELQKDPNVEYVTFNGVNETQIIPD